MSPFTIASTILLSTLLGGCAGGRSQAPASPTASTKEQRPAEELFVLGKIAAQRGDNVRAEQYLALAIEQGADQRRVLPMLLRACLSSSHLRAALNHAEPYLLEHPHDNRLRYLVANVHLGLGQVVEARRELGLLLQDNPSNPDAHYLLGILEAANNTDRARAHFLKAVEYSRDKEQKTEIGSRLSELALRDSEQSSSGGSADSIDEGRP